MNKKLKYWWFNDGASAAAIDSDYQAVLNRGTALGYTLPSAGQQTKQNALVLALKAAGIWTGLDIFYVMANDGSKEFATLNWIAPTLFQCAFTGANPITLTTNVGLYRNNSASNYLNTNFKPATNGVQGTLSDMGMFAGVQETTGTTAALWAGSDLNNDTIRFSATQSLCELNNTSVLGVTRTRSNGLYHAKYTGGSLTLYVDGVSVGTSVLAASAVNNLNTLLLGDGNVAACDAKMSVFGRGASLTGKESALSTAWHNYYDTL